MKKSFSFMLIVLVSALLMFGCASKEAKDEFVIPTTVEGRTVNTDFTPVTSVEQIYGKWETVLIQEFSEADYGVPGGVVIPAPYSFEVPVEYEGKLCGMYQLSCDYTEFIDKMIEVYLAQGMEVTADFLWANMIAAQPQYEYTSESPYIMYVTEYVEITDNPADFLGMYINSDGSQLKITDGISMELLFDKVN